MASGVPTFSWAPTVAWRTSWLLSCSTRIRAGTASSATSPIYPKVSATAARIFHFWSCNTRINPGQISIIALIAPGVPILNKAVEALKRTYSCLSCMLKLEQVLHHEQTITRLAILESVPELSPFFSSFPITLLQKHGLPDLDLSRIELEQVPHPLSSYLPNANATLLRTYRLWSCCSAWMRAGPALLASSPIQPSVDAAEEQAHSRSFFNAGINLGKISTTGLTGSIDSIGPNISAGSGTSCPASCST